MNIIPHAITLALGTLIGSLTAFISFILFKSYAVLTTYATWTAVGLAVGSTLMAVVIGAGIVVFSMSYLIRVSRQS
jgi:hypothetical protein